MKLSSQQISFLEKHKVPLWYILDATGMNNKEYSKILNETDNLVAINSLSKPCNKGHTLNIRDRHGRCVECRVSSFSFIRPDKEGYVYVLGSLEGKILKVGYTYDIEDRYKKIIHDGYGGFKDWKILYYGKYNGALNIEIELHSKLKNYGTTRRYSHYGKIVDCYELYQCSYKKIYDEIITLNETIGDIFLGDTFEIKDGVEKYYFSDTTDIVKNMIPTSYENDYEYYLIKYGIILQ